MVPMLRVPPNAAKRAVNLLRTMQFGHAPACPCHSNPGHHHPPTMIASRNRKYGTPLDPASQKEYAFEVAASSIRYGPGATQEVGMDFVNMCARRVAIVTDGTVDKLIAMKQAREALDREGVLFDVFKDVRIEPKESS